MRVFAQKVLDCRITLEEVLAAEVADQSTQDVWQSRSLVTTQKTKSVH